MSTGGSTQAMQANATPVTSGNATPTSAAPGDAEDEEPAEDAAAAPVGVIVAVVLAVATLCAAGAFAFYYLGVKRTRANASVLDAVRHHRHASRRRAMSAGGSTGVTVYSAVEAAGASQDADAVDYCEASQTAVNPLFALPATAGTEAVPTYEVVDIATAAPPNDAVAGNYDSVDSQQAPPAADASLKQSSLAAVYDGSNGPTGIIVLDHHYELDTETETDALGATTATEGAGTPAEDGRRYDAVSQGALDRAMGAQAGVATGNGDAGMEGAYSPVTDMPGDPLPRLVPRPHPGATATATDTLPRTPAVPATEAVSAAAASASGCKYVSTTGRACQHPRIPPSSLRPGGASARPVYCSMHTCQSDGCLASKPSKETFCLSHCS